jgi:hypothetical protein
MASPSQPSLGRRILEIANNPHQLSKGLEMVSRFCAEDTYSVAVNVLPNIRFAIPAFAA